MIVSRCILPAAVSALLLAGTGCSSSSGGGESADGGSCPATPTSCPATPPSYASTVQPLIETYCYQCHADGGVGINGGQYDWTQLSKLQANGSLIANEVTASANCNMPFVQDDPKVLPDSEDRVTIATWAGPCKAPNN
jgi:hypothetical protein